MDDIKLKGTHFSLKRILNKAGVKNDGFGDSGLMFNCIAWRDDECKTPIVTHGEIKLGCSIQCGTPFARTMQWQDYVVTTPVTKILSVKEENGKMEVKFKTLNSTYIATSW